MFFSSNPSRLNPSLATSPSSAWLSAKHSVVIFSTPSANRSANTSRNASAVVSWPQKARLKTQCASACTGVKRIDVTTPPSSLSRNTAQLRIPARSRSCQKLTNSASVPGAKSSATCRRDCSIQAHARGSA